MEGALIPGQTVALGCFSFGPEIAYRLKFADKSFIEPQLSLLGLWNLDRERDIVFDGVAAGQRAVGRTVAVIRCSRVRIQPEEARKVRVP